MKTVFFSPESVKQMNPISMENILKSNNKDEKESNYFHGCRKDANCECKMCLDSITATLDLMSLSVQRSSLTKLSASKPVVDKTPVSIDPTLLSTPTSKSNCPVVKVGSSKPALASTAKSGFSEKVEVKKRRKLGCGFQFWRWVLLLGLVFGLEFGFSWAVIRVLRPRFSEEMLRNVVEEFSHVENLSQKLRLIQKKFNDSINGELMSSCILGDSTWKINQDGLILMSHCNLYKSVAEEVLIWGWPLQTGGVFTAGFSPRFFILLSGIITEWPEGKINNVVRGENTTWNLQKWSASVVQLKPNTWILEYRRSFLLENPSLFRVAIEFIKLRISKFKERMNQHVWLLSKVRYFSASASEVAGLDIPT